MLSKENVALSIRQKHAVSTEKQKSVMKAREAKKAAREKRTSQFDKMLANEPKFREFYAVMEKREKSKLWANDSVAASQTDDRVPISHQKVEVGKKRTNSEQVVFAPNK